jgi:hypothetical protein
MDQFLAPPLTEQDKQFLWEQRHSEHFRVYQKAITWLYSLECARIASSKAEDLLRHQGVLNGLLTAKNILVHGKVPESSK